jgi:hypothetical protein
LDFKLLNLNWKKGKREKKGIENSVFFLLFSWKVGWNYPGSIVWGGKDAGKEALFLKKKKKMISEDGKEKRKEEREKRKEKEAKKKDYLSCQLQPFTNINLQRISIWSGFVSHKEDGSNHHQSQVHPFRKGVPAERSSNLMTSAF